jgi:hypothetical protein
LGGTLPVIALLDSASATAEQADRTGTNGTGARNDVELAKSA